MSLYAKQTQYYTCWLVGCEISVPCQQKIGYTRDKVLGGDLVQPGLGWPTIQ